MKKNNKAKITPLIELEYYQKMANEINFNNDYNLWYYLQTKIILPIAKRLTHIK